MFPTEVSNLPGQIEAALQFLRFTEELQHPHSKVARHRRGRTPKKRERSLQEQPIRPPLASTFRHPLHAACGEAALPCLQFKDSALTVLLEYFNHPVPAPEQRQWLQRYARTNMNHPRHLSNCLV